MPRNGIQNLCKSCHKCENHDRTESKGVMPVGKGDAEKSKLTRADTKKGFMLTTRSDCIIASPRLTEARAQAGSGRLEAPAFDLRR